MDTVFISFIFLWRFDHCCRHTLRVSVSKIVSRFWYEKVFILRVPVENVVFLALQCYSVRINRNLFGLVSLGPAWGFAGSKKQNTFLCFAIFSFLIHQYIIWKSMLKQNRKITNKTSSIYVIHTEFGTGLRSVSVVLSSVWRWDSSIVCTWSKSDTYFIKRRFHDIQYCYREMLLVFIIWFENVTKVFRLDTVSIWRETSSYNFWLGTQKVMWMLDTSLLYGYLRVWSYTF